MEINMFMQTKQIVVGSAPFLALGVVALMAMAIIQPSMMVFYLALIIMGVVAAVTLSVLLDQLL